MARIVLIADDSPTIQKRALGILKGEGFEVETVSNGVAAIKRLAVLRPVVILADVSMPGRDGYEVCEFVKKSPELSQVPVLLVASDMEPYDNARGAEVRADDIIKKPFEAQELIAIVVKFADQFEAATTVIPAPPVAPPPVREPTQDFATFREEPDDAPTVVHHVAADFSEASEGVAFAEPTAEPAPVYSPESPAAAETVPSAAPQAEAEFYHQPAPEPQIVYAEESPLAFEAPPAPSPFAPPPPLSPPRAPSFLEGLEASTPEPVFIEEEPGPAPEPPSSSYEARTMIFRAPLEIAEPVWKDETVSAPPAAEPAGATAVEPQLEPEAHAATPEVPVEQLFVPPHSVPSVTATSLDSFSLDDAAAGQIHFASQMPEVVYSAPAQEAPTAEVAPPEAAPEVTETAAAETTPEAVYVETAAPETTPEVVYMESAPLEAAPEMVDAQAAPAEAAPEVVETQAAPPEAAPEIAETQVAPPEAAPEMVDAQAAPAEAAPEVVETQVVPPEPAPEMVDAQPALAEAAPEVVETQVVPPEPAPEMVDAQPAPAEAAPEAVETQVAPLEATPQAILTESAPPEAVPEAVETQVAVAEAAPEAAPPEPAAEPAAPLPAFNWDLIYSVIHKVVLRMAPPALSTEVVEEITRRLADEIATEISTGSPQPRS